MLEGTFEKKNNKAGGFMRFSITMVPIPDLIKTYSYLQLSFITIVKFCLITSFLRPLTLLRLVASVIKCVNDEIFGSKCLKIFIDAKRKTNNVC